MNTGIVEEFLADLVTFLYNIRVYVIMEQPVGSKMFSYSPMRVTSIQQQIIEF